MGAGDYRHLITIQAKANSKDAMGGLVRDWDDYLTIWAKISPLKGSEVLIAQQKQGEITHRIKIRYQEDITTKHRIVFGDRIFEIINIININERSRHQEIMAKESNV